MRTPTLGTSVGVLVAGCGAMLGRGVLSDNSFLTHLATGRLIFDGLVPRTDPYTFTAAGETWVVQSWLASALYGALAETWGLGAIRILMVVTGAVLGAIAWRLTVRAQSALVRLALCAAVLAVGTSMWPHRPLLLGLVGLGVSLLAAEGRLDPRFLLPVGWLWLNVHGSWPLGVAALGCLWVGARLDGDDGGGVGGGGGATERRALLWLGGGLLLGMVNPYGPALLLFPLGLLSRRESLEGIVEWQAMDFSRTSDWVFLGFLMVGVLGLCRRPSWRAAVPLVVFGAAAITGVRNVPVATLVLLPGLAAAFADVGGMRADTRPRLARALLVLGIVVGVLAVTLATVPPNFDDVAYPVDAVAWLEDNDLHPATHRVVARELVGNYLEARFGATGTVFMDDRIEVIPAEVVEDHRALLGGAPGWEDRLAGYEPDAVLWEVESPLAQLLAASSDWSIEYEDDDWLVAVPVP